MAARSVAKGLAQHVRQRAALGILRQHQLHVGQLPHEGALRPCLLLQACLHRLAAVQGQPGKGARVGDQVQRGGPRDSKVGAGHQVSAGGADKCQAARQ